jgi:Tol biopolymer transport system component
MIFTLLFNFIGCKENSLEPNTPEIKVTKITNVGYTGVYEAKLTPNKSKVLYSFSKDYGISYEVNICEINGNNNKKLVEMGYIGPFFTISEDETKLAFLASQDGGIQTLYLLDIPSNQLIKLAEEESSVDTAYFPKAFSSDNKKILCTGYYYHNSVYLFDIETRTAKNLTGDKNSYPISFTKDENEILYHTFDQICLINVDGSNDRVILEGFHTFYCIGFTQNGNSIIFSAFKPGESGRNIYKINKDGSNLIQVSKTV